MEDNPQRTEPYIAPWLKGNTDVVRFLTATASSAKAAYGPRAIRAGATSLQS